VKGNVMLDSSISTKDLTKLDIRYIQMAIEVAASKSHDGHSQVGCVIASANKVSLVCEANTFPEGYNPEDNPELLERPEKYYWMNHAEMVAMYQAADKNILLKGAHLYCTKFPCVDCARSIFGFKIARVVAPAPDFTHPRWGEGWKRSYEILNKKTNLVCLPMGARGKL
jgi:dCMP deaminase